MTDRSSYFGVPSSAASPMKYLRRNSAPSVDSLDESYFDNGVSSISTDLSSRSLLFGKGVGSTSITSGSPVTSPGPLSPSTSTKAARTQQHRLNAAQEQRMYHDSCQRLLSHITSVMGICEDLQSSNKDQFPIRYPMMHRPNDRPLPQRSQTMMPPIASNIDCPLETASQPDVGSPSSILDALHRRSSIHSQDESTSPFVRQLEQHRLLTSDLAKELSILNLDLKMGHSSTDLNALESKSIANLLDDRLSQCLRHLEKLRTRVADTSSKVLVTGDLNAGKSTFVNALLKREVLPADQQPCTSMFCEVLDAMLNDGVEAIHAIPDASNYNRLDPSTYHVIEERHMFKTVADEGDKYKMLKIYSKDARNTQESLLHNGVVDIALIDSPGLNTDSVKTTAVFARQEEIDVVVFVVSAENHFTLSGKEFLWNAANEKTHIFIVVNRFDSIRDKQRCKRLILDQIRQLSPATYADADDLVHFVSAGDVDLEPGSTKLDAPEFARLEQRLRAFVLENRTKSKLSPAKNYLVNLLSDVNGLSMSNSALAKEEREKVQLELEEDKPGYEHLLRVRDRLLHQVEKVAEITVLGVQKHARQALNTAVEGITTTADSIEYPGIFLIWQYAQDIADSMSQTLLKQVRRVEGHAREDTSQCIDRIHDMGTEHLGNYPRVGTVEKMCLKNRDRAVVISVEPTDFFDLSLDDKMSGCALSFGAVAMVGTRLLGVKDAVSGIWSLSSAVSARSMRQMIVPIMSIAGAGLLVYVVSDMRYAVKRKLVRKFKTAVRDTAYVEGQCSRIGREARKALRVEGWEIQNRLVRAIENKEKKRSEMEHKIHHAEKTIAYFDNVLENSLILLDKVQTIQTDHHHSANAIASP
ncbi:transmembrane gtpase fzo1 [Lichtheimia corymbifera JMRC:FSU:9682]|uniref:Transmembrane gtpase fzo1 n=1 Tax=Lichtheimia corymbifera JMRC:FSU:9682 TaxID=1263082 RepID=A0A068RGK9_9FUNG|nr:transmembrane gtpase fzo1 [Lichtheimia corymbifera JMRC:FSU:9682]